MDKRIQVKFENIIPSKNEESSNKSISKETKSKIVKNNKPVNNQVTSKSPDNKKVIKDKKGNVVQPFSHHFNGVNQNGDIQKSIQGINNLINDYSNLDK